MRNIPTEISLRHGVILEFHKNHKGLYNYRLQPITYFNNEPHCHLSDTYTNVSALELRSAIKNLRSGAETITIRTVTKDMYGNPRTPKRVVMFFLMGGELS